MAVSIQPLSRSPSLVHTIAARSAGSSTPDPRASILATRMEKFQHLPPEDLRRKARAIVINACHHYVVAYPDDRTTLRTELGFLEESPHHRNNSASNFALITDQGSPSKHAPFSYTDQPRSLTQASHGKRSAAGAPAPSPSSGAGQTHKKAQSIPSVTPPAQAPSSQKKRKAQPVPEELATQSKKRRLLPADAEDAAGSVDEEGEEERADEETTIGDEAFAAGADGTQGEAGREGEVASPTQQDSLEDDDPGLSSFISRLHGSRLHGHRRGAAVLYPDEVAIQARTLARQRLLQKRAWEKEQAAGKKKPASEKKHSPGDEKKQSTADALKELDDILSFFLWGVFGPAAPARLAAFIEKMHAAREVAKHAPPNRTEGAPAETDLSITSNADLGGGEKLPETHPLYGVVRTYSKHIRSTSSLLVHKRLQMLYLSEFFERHSTLAQEIYNPRSDISQKLEAAKIPKARGRSRLDHLNDWTLTEIYRIPFSQVSSYAEERKRMKNELSIGHKLNIICAAFRPGVVLLIPDGSFDKIRAFGISPLQAVVDTLVELEDRARQACQKIQNTVLRSILEGKAPQPVLATSANYEFNSHFSFLELVSPRVEDVTAETLLAVEDGSRNTNLVTSPPDTTQSRITDGGAPTSLNQPSDHDRQPLNGGPTSTKLRKRKPRTSKASQNTRPITNSKGVTAVHTPGNKRPSLSAQDDSAGIAKMDQPSTDTRYSSPSPSSMLLDDLDAGDVISALHVAA